MTATARVRFADRQRSYREQKRIWRRSRAAENEYGRRLRAVADQVGRLVDGLPPDDPSTLATLENSLRAYSRLLEPWARSVAAKMIHDVSIRDESMWRELSKEMGLSLREEIKRAPTGQLLKDMLAENVKLITSLPTQAAERVHELALRNLETATRASDLAEQILQTGEVTKSRAMLIARTETARVASGLIEARATHIGCTHYIWRSSEDSDVRNKDGNPVGSHRLLNGKVIAWDSPPVASTSGDRYHAGQGPNCRCWPEPIVPKEF